MCSAMLAMHLMVEWYSSNLVAIFPSCNLADANEGEASSTRKMTKLVVKD